MIKLPIHKVAEMYDYGVVLKTITPDSPRKNVEYSHLDDYYIFGFIEEGDCRLFIDFKEIHISKGGTIFIQPGQIHRFVSSDNLTAYILIIDDAFVSDTAHSIFDEYALNLTPFQVNEHQQTELKQIFSILSNRMKHMKDKQAKDIIKNLSAIFIGIIIEALQTTYHVPSYGNKRQIAITLSFQKLLKVEFQINKRPSYYASRLNISSVYLNEVIKSVTGMNVSQYIQNEMMLQAKRMLIYTNNTIQEIAIELGYNDYSYFTKLFTKVTGTNPSSFRKKNLE